MTRQYDRLLSFVSVHHAIRAEKLLAGEGIKVMPLPTPREIAISCGQCLLLRSGEEARALAVLKTAGVEWSKLYSRDETGRAYEKLAEYEG
ncbi:MAG: DUF3343 domain-containing protein [Negativicutes bacterium]|nr:DUF3343 domain-containing protein [Negativicutes bacterium]